MQFLLYLWKLVLKWLWLYRLLRKQKDLFFLDCTVLRFQFLLHAEVVAKMNRLMYHLILFLMLKWWWCSQLFFCVLSLWFFKPTHGYVLSSHGCLFCCCYCLGCLISREIERILTAYFVVFLFFGLVFKPLKLAACFIVLLFL